MKGKESIIFSNYRWLLLIALLIQLSLVLAFAVISRPFLLIGSVIVVSLFLYSFFSVPKTFLLLIIYISILPSFGWGSGYSIFNVYASTGVIFLILLLIILYWLSKKCVADDYTKDSLTSLGLLTLLFFCVVFFSALKGFLYNFPLRFIFREIAFLSLYPLGYFIVYFNFREDKWIRRFWIVIIAVSLIAAFEYMLLTVLESGSLGIVRIVTQQTHLTQLSIPFLLAFFIFYPAQKRRIFPIIMLFPLFIMVFISQQRGLWIGMFISLVVLFFLSLTKKEGGRKRAILIFLIMVLISFLALMLIKKLFPAYGIEILMIRALTLRNLPFDTSLLIRQAEIGRAWLQCKNTLLTGSGLGAYIGRVAVSGTSTWDTVDNSYIFLIWKTGIIGISIYLAIVFIFLKNALFIFKRDPNIEHQIIAAGSIAGFIGLMVIALTNTCLVMYRFNILWASLFAIIEILKEKQLKNENRLCSTK